MAGDELCLPLVGCHVVVTIGGWCGSGGFSLPMVVGSHCHWWVMVVGPHCCCRHELNKKSLRMQQLRNSAKLSEP